ncbi:MAG TPA: cytochrome c oxidase subunit II [Methylomirabilota bacterium]|jgi:cytochrome c oxidase subunit 2|nr:cytochrome c oxidase subunit II [Methylomirabilota bacterium]
MMRWLPENISTYGAEIDWLFYLIYYITGVTFILVAGAMIIFLVAYRHREGRRATYTHGNATLEIVWTIVPALILVILTFLSVPGWTRIKSRLPESDIHIRITAKQFNWEVTYPGPDGKFETEDDQTFDNEVHVPVGKPVILHLTSRDVIHSVFIPQARFKQDAVPGRVIHQWVEVTKPGKYEIPCAELCGFGHSGMKGFLFVHTAEEYQQWLKEKWPS